MLQNIRKSTQGTAAKVIIGLIVISFALFGIESILVGGGDSGVAEVNGETISAVEVQQQVNIQKRRLINMLGDNLDPAMLDDQRLESEAINSIVERTLLTQKAAELGLTVSEEQIGRLIAGMEQFQVDGQFSSELYKNTLASAGYTPASFKRALQEDLLVNHLQSGLFASEFATSEQIQDNIRLLKEQRDVRYLTMPMEGFRQQAEPAPEEIQAYYEENRARFTTEETVDVNYIELGPEQFFEPVSEEALREEYRIETSAREYRGESRVSHILLTRGDNESKEQFSERLSTVQEALEAGEEFTRVAREYSDDVGSAGSGGDLGFTSGDTFPRAMEKAIADLEVGEISEPVKTDAGIHIIKLGERRAGEPPPFEELRDELERRIQEREAKKELLLTVEELRDLSFNADNLREPAKELGLSLQRAEGITRDESEGLFANQAVSNAAFSDEVLLKGHNSPVIELGKNRYVTLRVRAHHEPELKPLSQVRDEIVAAISHSRAQEELNKAAREAVETLRSGAMTLEEFANEHGYEWNVQLGVQRSSSVLPVELRERVFAMPAPAENDSRYDYVTLPESDVLVFELDRVKPGNPETLDEDERLEIVQRTRSELAQLISAEYLAELRREADIERY